MVVAAGLPLPPPLTRPLSLPEQHADHVAMTSDPLQEGGGGAVTSDPIQDGGGGL